MFTAAPCRAPLDFSPGAKLFYLIIDSNTVLHWGTSILERFSYVVQNITARDPHTRLKNLKQILAVFYDFFKAANSKLYGSYLSDFETVVRQFL